MTMQSRWKKSLRFEFIIVQNKTKTFAKNQSKEHAIKETIFVG